MPNVPLIVSPGSPSLPPPFPPNANRTHSVTTQRAVDHAPGHRLNRGCPGNRLCLHLAQPSRAAGPPPLGSRRRASQRLIYLPNRPCPWWLARSSTRSSTGCPPAAGRRPRACSGGTCGRAGCASGTPSPARRERILTASRRATLPRRPSRSRMLTGTSRKTRTIAGVGVRRLGRPSGVADGRMAGRSPGPLPAGQQRRRQ